MGAINDSCDSNPHKPIIVVRKFHGSGTRANPIDWIDKHTLECLSQGEKWVYLYLRWDDNVVDIREQVPMDPSRVKEIVEQEKLNFSFQNQLSTDFLVSHKNGQKVAYSVKNDESVLNEQNDPNGRTAARQFIECKYWESQENTTWKLLYKSRLNRIKMNNIRICVRFYDLERVWDANSMIAHMISRKMIQVDMESQIIDFPALVKEYFASVTYEDMKKSLA